MIKRIFSFKSRTARQEWWLFHLGVGIPYGLFTWIVGLLAQGDGLMALWLSIAYLVLCLLLCLIYLPIDVRRCHDRNRSGVIAYIVFTLGLLSPFLNGGIIGLVINVCYVMMSLICLGSLRGSKGENRFGEDPIELRKSRPESSNFLSWFVWILLACACLCGVVLVAGQSAMK